MTSPLSLPDWLGSRIARRVSLATSAIQVMRPLTLIHPIPNVNVFAEGLLVLDEYMSLLSKPRLAAPSSLVKSQR